MLQQLDIHTCWDRAVRQLSGGQRKRVSMGVELLTRPSLFFLDEATSGLDPGTESQMMRLLRRLADEGRTVVLVTHATKNVMTCDKVVFLARGGHLAYFGGPDEALRYFDVSDFDEIYTRLEEGKAHDWGRRFRTSQSYRENVESRLAAVPRVVTGAPAQFPRVVETAAAQASPPGLAVAAAAQASLPAVALAAGGGGLRPLGTSDWRSARRRRRLRRRRDERPASVRYRASSSSSSCADANSTPSGGTRRPRRCCWPSRRS